MSEVTAYHEAGHAFVALQLGARVLSMTVDPEADEDFPRHGDTEIGWPQDEFSEQEIARLSILVALAGPVAEMIHTGDKFHPALVREWSQDWRLAWRGAAELYPDQPRRLAFLEQIAQLLYRRLTQDDQWTAIAVLVDHLLAHETLEEDQIVEAVEDWLAAWDGR